jgi:hypothetical protein
VRSGISESLDMVAHCDRRHRPLFRITLILDCPVLVAHRPARVALRLKAKRATRDERRVAAKLAKLL